VVSRSRRGVCLGGGGGGRGIDESIFPLVFCSGKTNELIPLYAIHFLLRLFIILFLI
jgi:hypothetical protein